MKFGVLGPLQVIAGDSGERGAVPAARLRALLAVLLWRAGQPVPADELAELVWDGTPPRQAPDATRVLVMRLRRQLDKRAAARIVTHAPGYAIEISGDELDTAQFETLTRETGTAVRAGQWAQAARTASEALGLWRGTPLADVPSQLLRDRWVPHLDQLHLQALEWHIEAGLHEGRYEELIPELRDLTARHPLRERFHGQLILALYQSWRQAEALAAYSRARDVLTTELGVEPGAELRELHQQILAGSDVQPAARPPAVQAAGVTAAVKATVVPRQLPAAPGHFTGRRTELDLLAGLAGVPDQADGAGGTVVISAIEGMAGIGKTALAVYAGHRLAGRFPDGQLFIDLHGYTKGHPPREPGQALDWLLRALGISAQQIPEDTEARAALYRQRLAGTSTLIVLDNAVDEAQVRALLPGVPGCLVLVTSRRRLKGLDDARTVSLDLLPPADAVALLRTVAGPGRAGAGDRLLGEVAELCGRLPLALRIAGALLRHRPAWDLEHLAGLLRGRPERVRVLSDGERDLGAVFGLSYAGLGEQHRLLFRRLGLVPGPDADAYAAAALLGCDPGAATGLLEDLVDHNLLIAHAPGRYRLHDLLRGYARTLAGQDLAGRSRAALDRLLHYYAHTSQTASIPLARYPRPAADGPAPAHVPALTDPDAARAWLRTERENLEAAVAHARMSALAGHLIALAAGLAEILCSDGPFTRALDLHQAAADIAGRHGRPATYANALIDLGTARRRTGNLSGAATSFTRALQIYRDTGDLTGQANALAVLGGLRFLTADLPGAAGHLTRALEIYRKTGDLTGQAAVLTDLGRVRQFTGDLPGAAGNLTRALEIYRAAGHRSGEAAALAALGTVRQLTGDLPGAAGNLTRALEIYRATGDLNNQASALNDLGIVRRLTGDLPGAGAAHAWALQIYRAIGHRNGEAAALAESGRVRLLTGDLPGAVEAVSRALDVFRETGHRNNEACVLNYYAATVAATGDLPRARALYQQSLAMNRELNKPDEEAIALEGLGECHLAAGETEPAASHLRQALEIYQRLGMEVDTRRVQDRLSAPATR
jgi:DNA-binding SARP family transcriptional activator/tetratricopeptide (TPR) repeat protein